MLRLLLGLALANVAAGCAKSPPIQPDIGRILDAQMAKAIAADPSIKCERRSTGLASYDCEPRLQPRDPSHYALLSVAVQRAEGELPTRPGHVVRVLFGPGGGGANYKGRTRDGRYDVLARDMQNLNDGQESFLPVAPTLIDTVLATYNRSVRGAGEADVFGTAL